MNQVELKRICHLCGSENSEIVLKINQKPLGETFYNIPDDKYYREVRKCNMCGVFFNSREDLIPEDFYEGQYNQSIVDGDLKRRFNKIINFNFSKSDNKNRVLRIVNHLYKNDFKIKGMDVLDVGSGTGVFLYEMKKFGFNCYSVDPDPASVKHSLEEVEVENAYCGTLDKLKIDRKFDLICFNKVLEHIIDPISVLKDASKLLKKNGIIYIELPDGSKIQKNEITNRSEFFIDHHTTWTKESIIYLAAHSGHTYTEPIHIVDPSTKHTIFIFLSKIS